MKILKQTTNTLILAFGHGGLVCYSYGVPVLVALIEKAGEGVSVYATDKKFSKTTSKHLNHWKRVYSMVAPVQIVPHDVLRQHEVLASKGGA